MQKLEVGNVPELRIRKRDRSDNSAFGSEDLAQPAQTCVDRVFAFVRARFKSYLSTLTTLGCLFVVVGLALKLLSVQYTQNYMNNFEDGSVMPIQTAPMSSLKPGGLRGGEQGSANHGRDWRSGLARCQHTPGRLMTADSLGALCLHTQLNSSGCCDMGHASATPEQVLLPGFTPGSPAAASVLLPTRYACELCRNDNMCCSSYESCVSCCLSPEYELQRQSLRQRSSLFAYSRMAEDDSFAFCAYKCRTSSASLLHENTYRSPMVHCYGMYAPSLDNRVTVNSDRSSLRPFVPAVAEGEPTKLVDIYFQHAARLTTSSASDGGARLDHGVDEEDEPGPG